MATILSGFPQVFGADILENSSIQNFPIGAYMESSDGRGFRYFKNGAVATVAGKVYQGPAADATNYTPSGGLGVSAAVAVGDTSITCSTSTTWTANALAGGYLSVDVTPGQGYLYKIKGNTATAGATGGIIYLEDPIRVALTTSSKFIVTPHPYNGAVIEPGTPTSVILGVAPGIVTAAYYGWMQTKGVCSVLFTGTGVAGKAVGSLSGGTSGSMAPCIAATNIAGYHVATGITGEYSLVNLCIN